jgi:hypothetical protein
LELLTPKQTQRIFNCSLAMVYKLADTGRLPCVRIPSLGEGKKPKDTIRFKKDDVFDFIERHYQKPTN